MRAGSCGVRQCGLHILSSNDGCVLRALWMQRCCLSRGNAYHRAEPDEREHGSRDPPKHLELSAGGKRVTDALNKKLDKRAHSRRSGQVERSEADSRYEFRTMGGLRAAAATALAVAALTAPASALYQEEAGLVDWYELWLASPALTPTHHLACKRAPRGCARDVRQAQSRGESDDGELCAVSPASLLRHPTPCPRKLPCASCARVVASATLFEVLGDAPPSLRMERQGSGAALCKLTTTPTHSLSSACHSLSSLTVQAKAVRRARVSR